MSDGFFRVLLGAAVFTAVLVVGAYAIGRASRIDPSGRHWLLRTLAVLSPLALLAAVALGLFGPHWPGNRYPDATTSALVGTALALMLFGALTSPVTWRLLMQRWSGRPASQLDFFQAPLTQLVVLFVLCAVYLSLVRRAEADLPQWLAQLGHWRPLVGIIWQVIHLALISVLLTLPVMALRALALRVVRAIARWVRRPAPL